MAPSPVQDSTAQGARREARPGSSPCAAAQLAALGGPCTTPTLQDPSLGQSLRFRAFVELLPLSPSTSPASLAQIWNSLGLDDSSSHHGIIGDRFLGQLLGCLIVCSTSKIWNIQKEAWDALQHLFGFIQQKKCKRSFVGLPSSTHRHLLIVRDSLPSSPTSSARHSCFHSTPAIVLLQKPSAQHKSSTALCCSTLHSSQALSEPSSSMVLIAKAVIDGNQCCVLMTLPWSPPV